MTTSRDAVDASAAALAALANAYAPYSHFRVGAALRARDGSVRVRARFDSIATSDREAIRQFVADIRYLKGEVSDARSPAPALTPSTPA